MPLLEKSTFRPPFFIKNGHVQTIYPFLFKKTNLVSYKRVRHFTKVQDFLDIDFSLVGSKSLVILTHGLEGNSSNYYISGMAKYFNDKGLDALAWNMRSCSEEMNLTKKFYHASDYEDLETIIEYALSLNYESISLVSFSLGASITAHYLGKKGSLVPPEVKSCVLFSTPCDLACSTHELTKKIHKVYAENFLFSMRKKIKDKQRSMNFSLISESDLNSIKSLKEFDQLVNVPLYGFKDAQEFWTLGSCRPYLPNIKIPTLMINAKNDPFLGEDCYPTEEAQNSSHLFLEIPRSGGHIGFATFGNHYWSESRAFNFINSFTLPYEIAG